MANEFINRNGFISKNDSVVTGSLIVTNGITGSLFGTSSWAQNAVSASYATSASFLIGGAAAGDNYRIITGSITASVNIGTDIFKIMSGSSTYINLKSNGNFLIGTTTDSGYKLYVDGASYLNAPSFIRGTGASFSGVILTLVSEVVGNAITFAANGTITLYGGNKIERVGDEAYRFTLPSSNGSWGFYNSVGREALGISDNTTSFGTTYNYFGNYGKSVVAKFTALDFWLLKPISPGAYTSGIEIKIEGGDGGNFTDINNQGNPGKLILKGGAALSGSAINKTGSHLELYGGLGTGNADGGNIIFFTTDIVASGSGGQTPVERMKILSNSGSIIITGSVAIGATAASAKLHVLSITEQSRLLYDASNYFSTTISSIGNTTFSLTGTSPKFIFSQSASFSSSVSLASNLTIDNNLSFNHTTYQVSGSTLDAVTSSIYTLNFSTISSSVYMNAIVTGYNTGSRDTISGEVKATIRYRGGVATVVGTNSKFSNSDNAGVNFDILAGGTSGSLLVYGLAGTMYRWGATVSTQII